MPILETTGAAIYFETKGSGAPLVLIPGFASGIWSWKYQTDALSRHFRVIVFDPRGISRSTVAAGEPVSVSSIADDVAALLNELEIDRSNILGISFGGFVAQDFAFRYNDRVDRVVLACTSYGGKGHVRPSAAILAAFASKKGLNSNDRIRQDLTMAFRAEFVKQSPEVVDAFCGLGEQNRVPEGVYMDQLLAATTFDLSSRVAEIDAETLVLTGEDDMVVPMENSRRLAAAMPNARLTTVAGGSHMFFVEEYERFNSMVIDFLSNAQ